MKTWSKKKTHKKLGTAKIKETKSIDKFLGSKIYLQNSPHTLLWFRKGSHCDVR